MGLNRSAYLTTGLAIKTLSNLSKADIGMHGQENLPDGPTIFVVNHFTRLETFLLPYLIYNLTDTPVWSLAHSSLFGGGLGRFFDLVGVVSTDNPQRDELIVKSLLTGEANWIIFPEGSMIKTKQIMHGGKFMVTDPGGMRKPHTGAASLALRTELFRRYMLHKGEDDESKVASMLEYLGISSLAAVRDKATQLVPVNVTYYPIRAKENVLSSLASRMVRDIPERMVEEIMTEGTMLLSGVDIDIRFGPSIEIAPYLERPKVQQELQQQDLTGFLMTPALKDEMRQVADEVMQRYMGDIYALTTVNHEHLFASFLRMYPYKRIHPSDLKRRVFLAATQLGDQNHHDLCLHKSLMENQAHLLTDDRYGKFENFLRLALEKGVLIRDGKHLVQDRSRLSAAVSFHRGRIDNPIEIMANEVEPLSRLVKLIMCLSWQPDVLLRFNMVRYLFKKARRQYVEDYREFGYSDDLQRKGTGKPFLLPSYSRKLGVVLVHSYLSAPAEVRWLAHHLQNRGVWVYAPRLPGHGTSSRDLASRDFMQWIEEVESGYVLMSNICERVVLGGISVGASLVLDVAARIQDVAGVFAVCPPLRLQDYSTNFMPAIDVWNRMVTKIRGGDTSQFFEFTSDNPHVNYRRNPFAGIREVGRLLESVEERLLAVRAPALVMQADNDPVVHQQSARKVFQNLGSREKQFNLINSDRHIIINGEGAGRVHRTISRFLVDLSQR